jgi:hypothetical protein
MLMQANTTACIPLRLLNWSINTIPRTHKNKENVNEHQIIHYHRYVDDILII